MEKFHVLQLQYKLEEEECRKKEIREDKRGHKGNKGKRIGKEGRKDEINETLIEY